MKKIVLAALLLVSPIAVGGAAKTKPLNMFHIQTPPTGVINFTANGSPNFNHSHDRSRFSGIPSSTNQAVTTHSGNTLSSALMQASSIGGSQGMTQIIGVSGNKTDGYTVTSTTKE